MNADRLDLDALAVEANHKIGYEEMRLDPALVLALVAAARHLERVPEDWRNAGRTLADMAIRADRAESERDAAQVALARVEALHWGRLGPNRPGTCNACNEHYPCVTIRAVAGVGQEAAHG